MKDLKKTENSTQQVYSSQKKLLTNFANLKKCRIFAMSNE